jgi:uncharacterized protein YdcH (DUF465 family)
MKARHTRKNSRITNAFRQALSQTRIAKSREENDAFDHRMDEHNWLDSHIRSLEEHGIPVSDFHIEDMQKRRLLLKDRPYALIIG